MQILFVHPNFPAQFGPALSRLRLREDVECVFVTHREALAGRTPDGMQCIPYETRGGATAGNHYCSRTFENAIWQTHAIYEACRRTPDLRPDLIVGHSGFGSTLFLRELYDCPILGYFEYFYHAYGSDLDFRPDQPPREIDALRARARNATVLLDLNECDAGYTPTHWQRALLPAPYRDKVDVIHDGVDTELWQRREVERRIAGEPVPRDHRIVTYCARGLESMRGFDVFVRVANRIASERADVLFCVVGDERSHYGHDARWTGGRSFREHVLESEQPDLSRFRFLGRVEARELAHLFSLSDLHVYPSVPFVLSWSLLDAMACECVVLASDIAPVREVVTHGATGFTADFFDEAAMAERALEVLEAPDRFRDIGLAARQAILREYALDVTYPRLERLMLGTARGETPRTS